MRESNIQADLLETARSLILRDPDHFSVAALCREVGVSRSKMRQYFPTKAALMTALLEQEPAQSEPAQEISEDEFSREEHEEDAASPGPIMGESWVERRFRVFERALALLENKSEGATVEQSRALTMIEERLSGPISASLAELPPVVETSKLAEPANPADDTMTFEMAASPITPPPAPEKAEPLTIPPLDFFPAAPAFHAREKLQAILENAPAQAVQTDANEREKIPVWMMFTAGLAATALLFSILLVISNARNAPKQVVLAQQVTAAAPAPKPIAAAHAYDAGKNVVVIDATGANSQSATPDIDTRAERGDTHAKVEAALAYLKGEGVAADAGEGMRWAQIAAKQGDAGAQFILGSLYAKGMAPDPQHAVKWYAAAAAKGNVKAMHNLALAYLSGDGVEENTATAIEWFTKAANGGYVDAAMNLAVLYDRGEGVDRSSRQALHWYDEAAAKGDTEAKRRAKALRRQLSRVAGR